MNTQSIPNEILLEKTARLIKEGHTVTHLTRGNSMNPFLVDRRDKVTLAPFTNEELQRGVLVLALDTTNRYVLHRIIRRNKDQLILMGDGNIRGTEETHPDRVVGVVREIVRKGKTYRCTGSLWRIYSIIWINILPLRRIVLGVWRKIFL